jgi:benzoate transport
MAALTEVEAASGHPSTAEAPDRAGGAPSTSAESSSAESAFRKLIARGPMSRFQVMAVAICVGLNMLDGFDVLVVAFTAASIGAEWKLAGAELGVLLSAGLLGMSIGSLLLAPFGDRFGRRPIILTCLVLMSIGMLLSSGAPDIRSLAALRVVTGIGIGGMLAAMNVITAEYASDRWRNTAMSAQATGYPIGATIGGTIAALLIATYGWRSVYVFGGMVSLFMIPIVLRGLPESMDFLISKRPKDALTKLNALLRRMGRPEVAALPERGQVQKHDERAALLQLVTGTNAAVTLGSWLAFFLVMTAFYFVLSWTPKLLVSAGMSTGQGITGGVLLNVGGIAGGIMFGYFSSRISLGRLIVGCLVTTSVLLISFGTFATTLGPALSIAALLGASIFGCMIGLYALAPLLYSAATRTTGMGWAIGIGRIGGIAAPALAGVLVDLGWKNGPIYYLFAAPLVIAVFVIRGLRSDSWAPVER